MYPTTDQHFGQCSSLQASWNWIALLWRLVMMRPSWCFQPPHSHSP